MNEEKKKNVAIVPSAGLGKRMGGTKKNYLKLASLPVLVHTLRALEECEAIDAIIVVTAAGDKEFCKDEIVDKYGIGKVAGVVTGGDTRQASVGNGLKAAGSGCSIVVVHDGARPLVTSEIIERCIKTAERTGAAITAVRVKDTIKTVSSGVVTSTLDRSELYSVQTPQAFRYDLLANAHAKALHDSFTGTDEASLLERIGVKVNVIEGSYDNIKITTPGDIAIAEVTLSNRANRTQATEGTKN